MEKGFNGKGLTVKSARILCGVIGKSFDALVVAPTDEKSDEIFAPQATVSSDLYVAVLNALELGDQSTLNAFLGKYTCLRLSHIGAPLITGLIEIMKDRSIYCFRHTSKQVIDGQIEAFDHEGPVYLLANRLYLVGVGVDSAGAYVRPIILQAVDKPRERELAGMLLTETPDYVPLACKTLLIHELRMAALLKRYPRQEDLEAFVVSRLKNESKNPDVLYGWSRRRPT